MSNDRAKRFTWEEGDLIPLAEWEDEDVDDLDDEDDVGKLAGHDWDEHVPRDEHGRWTNIGRQDGLHERFEGLEPGYFLVDPDAKKPPKHEALPEAVELAKAEEARARAELPKTLGDMERAIAGIDGAKLQGTEYAVKEWPSLSRKITTDWNDINHVVDGKPTVETPLSAEEVKNRIGDTLRFTATFTSDTYADDVMRAMARLEELGYTLVPGKFKNYWQDPTPLKSRQDRADTGIRPPHVYKGINVNLRSPTGRTIEMQFHTVGSYFVKGDDGPNHIMYEAWRVMPEGARDSQGRDTKSRLEAQMAHNAGRLVTPKGAKRIAWGGK